MARPRVLRGHFGPRLSRGVPNSSPAPHHRNNGHRREYFSFHFVAFPWNWDAVWRYSAGIRVQHDLALLRRNNSRGDRSVILRGGERPRSHRGGRAAASCRSQDDNLGADCGAVVKIDNVIIGQTDAAG
jgi:hypothetical protein